VAKVASQCKIGNGTYTWIAKMIARGGGHAVTRGGCVEMNGVLGGATGAQWGCEYIDLTFATNTAATAATFVMRSSSANHAIAVQPQAACVFSRPQLLEELVLGSAGVQLCAGGADFVVQVEIVDKFGGTLPDVLGVLVAVYTRHFHLLKYC
jgi:hypothetical protein